MIYRVEIEYAFKGDPEIQKYEDEFTFMCLSVKNFMTSFSQLIFESFKNKNGVYDNSGNFYPLDASMVQHFNFRMI